QHTMPAAPSPNGTNYAKLYLTDNWPNPVAAYDSKRGLAKYYSGLSADQKVALKNAVLGKDQETTDPLHKLLEFLETLPPSDELDGHKATLKNHINSRRPKFRSLPLFATGLGASGGSEKTKIASLNKTPYAICRACPRRR